MRKRKIAVLKPSELERLHGPVRATAEQLYRNGTVTFTGLAGGSLYFEVKNAKRHSVIYRIDSSKWLCDCTWSALKRFPYCSHILATHMLVNSKKQFFESYESRDKDPQPPPQQKP